MNIKDERGYTLVTVLLVILLLTILGGAYIFAMNFEVRSSYIHSDSKQAYYYARSGAEAGSDWVIANYKNEKENIEVGKELNTSFDKGNIEVAINFQDYGDEELIRINSTGIFRNREQNVTLYMKRSGLEGIFDKAVFSNSNLDLDKAQAAIYGDVETKGVVYAPENVFPAKGSEEEPEIIENSEATFLSADFPGLKDPGTSIKVTGNNTEKIESDGYYTVIETGPNATLEIHTETDKLRIIEVGYIDAKGTIEIVGGGFVYMFVHDGMEMRTPSEGSSEFVLILADDSYLTVQTPGQGFFGYVYGPGATANIQAHGTITGGIIINEISHQSQVYDIYWKEYPQLNIDHLSDFIQSSFQRYRWE